MDLGFIGIKRLRALRAIITSRGFPKESSTDYRRRTPLELRAQGLGFSLKLNPKIQTKH